MIQKKESWVFASFSNGSLWGPARRRIRHQAIRMNLFKEVVVADEKWLNLNCLEFTSLNKFFVQNPKGYGYWIWKPLVVETIFKLYPDCTGVVYADSGCELNQSGRERLLKYLEMSGEGGLLSFELPTLERDYTHPKLFQDLGFNPTDATRQIMATTFIVRNKPNTRKFLSDWFLVMKKNNFEYLLGEDGLLGYPNPKDFPHYRAHRHDQSIFSNLVRASRFLIIREESEWHPDWISKGHKFPIWATRNRLRISITSKPYKKFAYLILRKLSSNFTRKKYYF